MTVFTLEQLLSDLLRVLTLHFGTVAVWEAVLTLPGLVATWRLWGPLRSARRDLAAARAAQGYWRGNPEERIATERLAVLRFLLVVALWLDATGLLFMARTDTAITASERTWALLSVLLLVAGLLGLAVGIAVLATRLDRAGPRLLAAMREQTRRDSPQEPPIVTGARLRRAWWPGHRPDRPEG